MFSVVPQSRAATPGFYSSLAYWSERRIAARDGAKADAYARLNPGAIHINTGQLYASLTPRPQHTFPF